MKDKLNTLKTEFKLLFTTKKGILSIIISNIIWSLPWVIPAVLSQITNDNDLYLFSVSIFIILGQPLIPIWALNFLTAIYIRNKILK
jgi:hypothetical protein